LVLGTNWRRPPHWFLIQPNTVLDVSRGRAKIFFGGKKNFGFFLAPGSPPGVQCGHRWRTTGRPGVSERVRRHGNAQRISANQKPLVSVRSCRHKGFCGHRGMSAAQSLGAIPFSQCPWLVTRQSTIRGMAGCHEHVPPVARLGRGGPLDLRASKASDDAGAMVLVAELDAAENPLGPLLPGFGVPKALART